MAQFDLNQGSAAGAAIYVDVSTCLPTVEADHCLSMSDRNAVNGTT
jgi:hypothetical protein